MLNPGGRMNKALTLIAGLTLVPTLAFAQPAKPFDVKDTVELELLTHTEVYDKIHKEGKTSVLLVTGGTEERGPHNVLGGHTIMSRHRAVEIARRLGNALVAPVIPVAGAAPGVNGGTNPPGGLPARGDPAKTPQSG